MNRPDPLSMARDLLDFPALGFNPAPGSVDSVHEAVAWLDRTSQRIQEIGPRLDAEASWTGSAAEAYHAAAEQMQRRLAMRLEAVETVRQALRQWAGEPATNQEEARRYEREAEEAQHALAAARDHPIFAGAAATAAEAMGRTNAAHHMRHYLGNSGETRYVDPGRILRDCPDFRTAVENELAAHDAEWRRRALEELRKNGGKPVRIPVETDWQVYRVSSRRARTGTCSRRLLPQDDRSRRGQALPDRR